MSGYEVCCKLKENLSIEKIIVMFVLVRGIVEEWMEGYFVGVEDYIVKLFSY